MLLYGSSALFLLQLFSLCLSSPITDKENESHQDIFSQFPHVLVRDVSEGLPVSLFVKEGARSENVVTVAEVPQQSQLNPPSVNFVNQNGLRDFQTSVNELSAPQRNVQLVSANRHELPTAFVRSSFGGFLETNPKSNDEDRTFSQNPQPLPELNEIGESRLRENGRPKENVFKIQDVYSFNNQQYLPLANLNDKLAVDEPRQYLNTEDSQYINENRNEENVPVAEAVVNANAIVDVTFDQGNFRNSGTGIVHPYFLQQIDTSNNGKTLQNNQQNNQQLHQIVARESPEDLHQVLNQNNPTEVINENNQFARQNDEQIQFDPTLFEHSVSQDSTSQGAIVPSPLHNTGETIVLRAKPTLVLNNVQPSFVGAPENDFQQAVVQKRNPEAPSGLEEQEVRTFPFQKAKELQQNKNQIFENNRFTDQESAKITQQRSEPVPTADTQNIIFRDSVQIDEDSFRPSYFGRALDQEESQIVPQGRSLNPEDFSQGTFVPGKLEGGFLPSNFFGAYFQ